MAPVTKLLCLAALLAALTSCASVRFDRETETSGTFVSKAWAFTIFSIDFPQGAMQAARENASDANLSNTQVTSATVVPHLGWFDWVLDIIGVRYAYISGTWGFESG